MSVDFEDVKAKNPIERVMADAKIELEGRGRYLNAKGNHSFVVDLRRQCYFENGGGSGQTPDGFGHDVIHFVMWWKKCDVKEAVEFLCERAKLPAPVWGGDGEKAKAQRAQDDALTVAARLFVRWYRASDAAQAYARGRGWSDETIAAAGLGFSGDGTSGERNQLIEALNAEGHAVDEKAVKAVFAIPPKMLTYPHVRGGRVRYLSARHIVEKKHYNLQEDLVGKRQRYYNHEYGHDSELVAVVEGQADALTLAQWGIAAVALAGNAADEAFAEEMKKHRQVIVALDFEAAMWAKALKIAELLGPKTRLFKGIPA
jgi:DNA primase